MYKFVLILSLLLIVGFSITGKAIKYTSDDQPHSIATNPDNTTDQKVWNVGPDGCTCTAQGTASNPIVTSSSSTSTAASAVSATVMTGGAPVSPSNPFPVSGTVVQYGSDRSLPLYTTVTSQNLPANAPYRSQYAPGYVYGACTTCTSGAIYTVPVHGGNSTYNAYACVTFASGVFGVSYQFLTPAPQTRLVISLSALNAPTQPVYFVLTNSAIPPSDTDISGSQATSNREELYPGKSITIENVATTFIHFFCKNGPLTSGPFEIKYVYSNPYTGTVYPNN